MSKRVYESDNIEKTAAKIRELTGTATQYTSYDLSDGVVEVYNAGRAAGGGGGGVAYPGDLEADLQEIRTEIAELEANKQNVVVFDGVYNSETNPAATVETVAREVAQIVGNAPEGLDSLQKLAAWLETNGAEAAEMNAAIKANENEINSLKVSVENNAQRANTAYSTAINAVSSANSGISVANTALTQSDEARSIATEAKTATEAMADSKQDRLSFDGGYSPIGNPVATVQTVADRIAAVIASAPEDLDTLKEIAVYIASDKTEATNINNKLSLHETKITAIESTISNLNTALDELEAKHDADMADISSALDELHNYAQGLVSGGES